MRKKKHDEDEQARKKKLEEEVSDYFFAFMLFKTHITAMSLEQTFTYSILACDNILHSTAYIRRLFRSERFRKRRKHVTVNFTTKKRHTRSASSSRRKNASSVKQYVAQPCCWRFMFAILTTDTSLAHRNANVAKRSGNARKTSGSRKKK